MLRQQSGERAEGTLNIHLWPVMMMTAAALASPAHAREPVLEGPLYDGPAAGSEAWTEPRAVVERDGGISIYNTTQPRFELFLPDPDKASGAAVLMLPGGGLRVLDIGDGTDAEIDAFLEHGVAVMLLEYRTRQLSSDEVSRAAEPPLPRSAGAPPVRFARLEIRNGNANPAPGDRELAQVLKLATDDARYALAMLHRRADEWGLDPARIGAIGTSAGGGVAFGAVFAQSSPEEKPDFLISIFGPSLQDALLPDPAPPLFLVTEADHGPVTDGLLALFRIWKDADQKVELHVYEVPNFSMTVGLWGPRLFDWMRERGLLATDRAAR